MKIHWHFDNPWRKKAVYVPVSELIPRSDRLQQIRDSFGMDLDAYVLRQPDETCVAGIRYGAKPEEYLSIETSLDISTMARRHAKQWRPCDWDDPETHPTKDGMYFVRIAGDSETEGPHVYYDFPDYTTTAMVKLDNGEGDIFIYCEHDEEPDSIIAWYGPLTAPVCDCF